MITYKSPPYFAPYKRSNIPPPNTSQPQTPWIPVPESSNNPCNKTENLNKCPQISTQLSHNNPHSIITYLHLNLTFIFIISSQFPHIIPTAPSQTSHMHSYTIPTQLDTLKHHSDLPNRLQLDSVPEPYIYPLLQLQAPISKVCKSYDDTIVCMIK